MTDPSPDPPERVTTRLLLVRHGESVATVTRVVGGEAGCTGLSDLGRLQAERLRDRLAAGHEAAVDVVISSTLQRAVETAEIVNEALGVPLLVDDDLVEHRPGEADGLGWHEVEERFGLYEPERFPHRRMAPGAETLAEFHQRVGAAFHRLAEAHAGCTLLVSCHGGVIDMAMRGVLGVPYSAPYDLWTLNTSITEILSRHRVGSLPERWRLVRYNDAAHLAGLPDATPHRGAQAESGAGDPHATAP